MTRFIPIFLGLAACSGNLPGQFGEDETLQCVPVSETPVGLDDTVMLDDIDGVSHTVTGDSLTQPIFVETHLSEMSWGTESTDLTVEVTLLAGTVLHVEREARNDGEIVEGPTDACSSQLHVPVSASVTTADGRLDEAFDTVLIAGVDGSWVESIVDSPVGTIDPVALYDGSDPIEASAIQVRLAFLGTFSGSISPVRTDDPNDDVRTIGSWPLDGEDE